MKIEELKENNYILADGILVKIIEISDDKILGIEYPIMTPNLSGKRPKYKIDIMHCNIPKFNGLPLTEDILLGSPDVSVNPNAFIDPSDTPPDETIYFLGNIKLIRQGYAKWKAEFSNENVPNNLLILYVHELQNLYVNLMDKELEIKL